jgi:endogenous inhibitor of DNA gyrase (YacG/DUF329 family)
VPGDNVIRLQPSKPCPICRKPSSQQFHPFCSARCSDIDLNRWLSGAYVIPAEPVADDIEADDVIPGTGDFDDTDDER